MAKPVLILGGIDYGPDIEELKPSRNGLNADESGRDIQTGEMFRTKIADKLKFDVQLLPVSQSKMTALSSVLESDYFTAQVLHPATGAVFSGIFYNDTLPYGVQRYDRNSGTVYYEGVSFSITEK